MPREGGERQGAPIDAGRQVAFCSAPSPFYQANGVEDEYVEFFPHGVRRTATFRFSTKGARDDIIGRYPAGFHETWVAGIFSTEHLELGYSIREQEPPRMGPATHSDVADGGTVG